MVYLLNIKLLPAFFMLLHVPQIISPVDVKLDPATAHPSLLLTADLRSVQDGELWLGDVRRPESGEASSWCSTGLVTCLLRCPPTGLETALSFILLRLLALVVLQ